MSDFDPANPAPEGDVHPEDEGPSRRPTRAVLRPDFRALENAEDEDVEEWSSEGDEELERHARKRKGGKSSKSSSASRHRNKKTPAVDDLELSVKEAEAEVAALVPQAQAWKDRYVSLVAENEALKQRIIDLSNELVKRGGSAPGVEPMAMPLSSVDGVAGAGTGTGEPGVGATGVLPINCQVIPQLQVSQMQAPSPTPPLGFGLPPTS